MPAARADAFRLEPTVIDEARTDGLRFAIADPAWMLARQLQLGRFRGENAGSPASATITSRSHPLSRFCAGATPSASAAVAIEAPGLPLEARIENEWQPRDEPSTHLSATTGLHYGGLLSAIGERASIAAYEAEIRRLFSLTAPPDVDSTGDPLLELLPGRGIDGRALYVELAGALRDHGGLPAEPPVEPADHPDLLAVAKAFVAHFDAVSGRELPDAPAWRSDRLEYAASVSAATATGELVLSTSEYDSGVLDWYSFDVDAAGQLGAGSDPRPERASSFLPAPVSFRGMPAARLWQFEDMDVDLAGVEASAEDIATMLVVEFVLRYGNDHFVVPLPLDVGSVIRVESLVVTDTFGEEQLISPAAQDDEHFRLFEHSVAPGRPRELALTLFPTAVTPLESAPVESVAFLRDELANICWAVERIVVGPAGSAVDRAERWARSRLPKAPPAQRVAGADRPALKYVVKTTLPDYWFPLLAASEGDTWLRLPAATTSTNPPLGRVLTELSTSSVPQEEIDRSGRRVVRTWQAARGPNGRQLLWLGRRVSPEPSGGTPGLSFDFADEAAS